MRSYYFLVLLLVFSNCAYSQDISLNGKLKANVVRTGNIVDGAIDSLKIKDGSITSAKIATGAVTVADTTALKALTETRAGFFVYMQGLNSSTNPNEGGGIFIHVTSTYAYSLFGDSTVDKSITLLSSATGGMRWMRSLSVTGNVYASWGGVRSDSTAGVANNAALNYLHLSAYNKNKLIRRVVYDGEKYLVALDYTISDSYNQLLAYPNFTYSGYGASFYLDTTNSTLKSSSAFFSAASDSFRTALKKNRNITFEGMTLYGFSDNAAYSPGDTYPQGIWMGTLSPHDYRNQKALFQDITLYDIGSEGLTAYRYEEAFFERCVAYSGNFTFLNSSFCAFTEFRGCKAYNCRIGGETYGAISPTADSYYAADSSSVLQMFNCYFKTSTYGFEIKPTRHVIIQGCTFAGIDTVDGSTLSAAGYGVWFTSDSALAIGNLGFESIRIKNSVFDNNHNSAIRIGHTDAATRGREHHFGTIDISNNVIKSSYASGVEVIIKSPNDGDEIEQLKITGNTFVDWDRDATGAFSTTGSAISLRRARKVDITNNTFQQNVSGANRYTLYSTTVDDINFSNNNILAGTNLVNYSMYVTASTFEAYDNIGFNQRHRAINWDGTTETYQMAWRDSLGLWQGAVRGDTNETAKLYTTILDTACLVRYNTSGVAVDTTRIGPLR